MYSVAGYSDRWSVKPDQIIRFMASSVGDIPVQVRFERHLCADPNPAGPGLRQIAMPTAVDGEHQVAFQPAWLGSYAVATKPVTLGRQIGIGVTLWPTRPQAGPQALIALAGDGWVLVLGIDASGAFAETGGVRTSVAAPIAGAPLVRCGADLE